MKNYHHIIHNFPKNEPRWKRIFNNFTFAITVTRTTLRKSLLGKTDLKVLESTLEPGDILLVGQLKRVVHWVVRGPVTHAAIATGNGKIVQATIDGVEEATIEEVIDTYDTLAILRPRIANNEKKKIISYAIAYAYDKIGTPFNFFMESGTERFYCTQLVNDAYHHAGFHTGLANSTKRNRLVALTGFNTGALKPKHFVKGNFDIVYLSRHLHRDKKGKLQFQR